MPRLLHEIHPSQRRRYKPCANSTETGCPYYTRAEVSGLCGDCLKARSGLHAVRSGQLQERIPPLQQPPRQPSFSVLRHGKPCPMCNPPDAPVFPPPPPDIILKEALPTLEAPLNIVAVDIEASGLNSAFGRILCAGYYNMSCPASEVTLLKSFALEEEPELLTKLRDLWDDIDILVTYNGKKFDQRFLNGRSVQYGDRIRRFDRKLHIDLLKYTRQWRMGRHSLDAVTKLLKLPITKVHCDPSIWLRAEQGHPDACAQLLEHCRNDCLMLSPLLRIVKPQVVSITLGAY